MGDTMNDITWPLVHTLAKPAETPGGTISQLSLREPTVDDFLKHGVLDGELDGQRIVDLVATLSGKAHPVIRALPGIEILKLTKRFQDFFRQAAS